MASPHNSDGETKTIRLYGRDGLENGLIEDVTGCHALVEGGLCANLRSDFQQVWIRESGENDHGDSRILKARNQLEQDLEFEIWAP